MNCISREPLPDVRALTRPFEFTSVGMPDVAVKEVRVGEAVRVRLNITRSFNNREGEGRRGVQPAGAGAVFRSAARVDDPVLECGLNAVSVPRQSTWWLENEEIRPGAG